MEDYRTIRGTAIGEYEEKKSRFIAQLSFADSEEAAVAFDNKCITIYSSIRRTLRSTSLISASIKPTL